VRLAICIALAMPIAAAASEPVSLEFGRYLAKYPAMYATTIFSHDARDEIFDANGQRRDGVTPTYGAGSALPETRVDAQLEWFFPFFEAEKLPFLSSRLWTARADLGYAHLSAGGAIADYARANDLRGEQSGITDIGMHFGPVLYGSEGWRDGRDIPASIVFTIDTSVPIGRRHPDAAVNAGTNVFSYGATLGGYWRPIRGVFLDAGAHWRDFSKNDEPAFNAQEPTRPGAQWSFDATLAARVWGDLYASASFFDLQSASNRYAHVSGSAHPPGASAGMETFPDPSPIDDAGIRDRRADLGAHWFALQRLRLSAHYVIPLGGASGEFDLPYEQQPQNCIALPGGCSPTSNGTDHVDGLGIARVYASRYFMVSATWNFGQGDFWMHGP
jgi:hypothetical protein